MDFFFPFFFSVFKVAQAVPARMGRERGGMEEEGIHMDTLIGFFVGLPIWALLIIWAQCTSQKDTPPKASSSLETFGNTQRRNDGKRNSISQVS